MADTISAPDRVSRRDPRLDVFRGLALVMIFINHIPGTVFENYTSRNFGFSDAAEGFVLMSGIAAGIAYGPGMARAPILPTVLRIGHRIWTLYLVHIMVTIAVIGVVAAGARWFDVVGLLSQNNFAPIFNDPLGVMIGIPLMGHQLGYVNILPMYAVLLAGAPAMLWAAHRWPYLLLAASVAFWALTGQFRLNLPNYPNPGGWFFNPLAWQLIFVIGLVTGLFLRAGRRLVPVWRWLQLLAAAYLILALVWTKSPDFAAAMNHRMWQLSEAGAPFYISAFDKTFLTLPRLLHILAITYLISSLPVFRRAAGSALAAPLALLGRQALPVFALGTILSLTCQVIKGANAPSGWLDVGVIGGGICLQLALAWARERVRQR